MYHRERDVAVEAVLAACHLCRAVQERLVTEETVTKKDRSPVTVADFGAQAVINHLLAATFPADAIVGEEDASELRRPEGAALLEKVRSCVGAIDASLSGPDILGAIDRGCADGGATGRFWTLDPIDGTKGFIRGDQYAVALALIEDGHVVLGVLGCPNLPVQPGAAARGAVFAAERHGGAACRSLDGGAWFPVSVASTQDARHAVFCESVESGHTKHSAAAEIVSILGVQAEPVRIDSQCKYAAVARGEASVYLRLPTRADYEEKIWDHAAGWIVTTEAGGRVTDTQGRHLDFSLGRTLRNNKGVIATNGVLHEQVVDAVQQVLAKS